MWTFETFEYIESAHGRCVYSLQRVHGPFSNEMKIVVRNEAIPNWWKWMSGIHLILMPNLNSGMIWRFRYKHR